LYPWGFLSLEGLLEVGFGDRDFTVCEKCGLKAAYQSFKTKYERNNLPLPSQNPTRSKAHRLDCEFFDYIIQLLLSQDEKVETIRAVFVEGESIFPNSAIFDLAHVQIAVRNTTLIQESQLIETGDI
jgi:hypothetical protein